MAAKIDVMKQLELLHARGRSLEEEADALDAIACTKDLLKAFDDMLSRWWSHATPEDKALANRAADARRRFAGKDRPLPEPDYELGERRREAAQLDRFDR